MESVVAVGDASNSTLDPAWSMALGQANSDGSDVTTTSHNYSSSNVQSVNVNAPPNVNMSHVYPCSSIVDSSSPAPATPLSQRSDEFSNSHILEPGEIVPHVCVFSQVSSTLDSPRPLPPKKPLSPYMQFSKSIWQRIKSENPSFSVCEVGATIGRLWRELTDVEKQRYNDAFASDKLRYDVELQSYLKLTGLNASDVAKLRVKRSRSSKAQHHSIVPEAVSVPAGGASSMNDHVCEHMQSRTVLDTTDYSTPVGTDPSSFQNAEAAMDFAQLWGGQEVYADSQLLAGLAQGQGLFDNQGADGQANAAALMSLQTQQMVENECVQQMAALYSGQSSQVGNQCGIGSSSMQDSVMTSLSQAGASDGVWLWQQYADNQYQDGVSQNTGIQTQDGMIIYQINSNGEQQQLLGGTDGVVLEPGEVLGTGTSVEPCREAMNSSQIYNQMLYSNGASNWASKQGLKLADGEKHMLRSALAEKSKEVRRLTKELEQAYGLIHQLKQQNDIYQSHWCQEQQIITYTQIDGSTLENGTSVV